MDTKPPKFATEKDQRLLKLYGAVPNRGNLLHHQLEGRKYFDSGDFAMAQAHKSSDIGAVTTGSQHPYRQDVPGPSCPVPSSSNITDHANDDSPAKKRSGESKTATHPHHQQEVLSQEDGDPWEGVEQKHDA
ncbi:hypothetical protein F66182_6817 [Fusarium sp. NRRL 66182]|nr:hypothetical protein F66182_6817 [Fusarium sp. NRRL 66182]